MKFDGKSKKGHIAPDTTGRVFSPSFVNIFRAQHRRTAGVARLRDFVVITESSATAASENL